MNPYRIAFISLVRNTFDLQLAEQMINQARQALQKNDIVLLEPSGEVGDLASAAQAADFVQASNADLVLIFQATFADSSLVVTITENCPAPIFLWAVPEPWSGERLRLNSLCGINLAGHALGLRNRRYVYGYGLPEDPKVIVKICTLAAAGQLMRRLKNARLGVVGEHPAGMDSCHLDQAGLREVFGVEVEQIDLKHFFDQVRTVSLEVVATTRQALDLKLKNLADLEQDPLNGSLAVFNALKVLAGENKLDGLAVRCWPEFFTGLGCAACGAMSLLSDGFEGDTPVPCSCEADINGTLTQLILQWLSGQPAFGTDMVGVDVEKNQIALWHCGLAPLSMADPAQPALGGIHSNRKLPLVMDFALKPGRVTVARISQARGRLHLIVGHGEMLAEPKPFSGTAGVLRLNCRAEKFLDLLIGQGLEHHISMTYGDYVDVLIAYAELINLPVVQLI